MLVMLIISVVLRYFHSRDLTSRTCTTWQVRELLFCSGENGGYKRWNGCSASASQNSWACGQPVLNGAKGLSRCLFSVYGPRGVQRLVLGAGRLSSSAWWEEWTLKYTITSPTIFIHTGQDEDEMTGAHTGSVFSKKYMCMWEDSEWYTKEHLKSVMIMYLIVKNGIFTLFWICDMHVEQIFKK